MSEPDALAFGWLRSARAVRRIGLRALIGSAPGLALLAGGASREGALLLLGLGLLPALLAPVTLWAEANPDAPDVARRAWRRAQVVATLATLAIPFQARYTTVALAAGPGPALDALATMIARAGLDDVALLGVAAVALGGGLGAVAHARALLTGMGLSAREVRAETIHAVSGAGCWWSAFATLPFTLIGTLLFASGQPGPGLTAASLVVGLMVGALAAGVTALVTILTIHVLLLVDRIADALDALVSLDPLATRPDPGAPP